MFDYEKMIKRAVKFFPTWSDIRKRYNTSAGGKLIGSITEEVLTIEDAIEEYKKYYFLDTYEGHENEVVAFSYRASIGLIEDLNSIIIEYTNETLELTTDIDKFMNNINLAYYEEGHVYIKEEKYKSKEISITINETNNKYELEKVSVWNIFDEFAAFVGLERHKNETNEELQKRILYITKNKPNSSINGLKNAIVSELLTECPEFEDPLIIEKDIKIEQVNESNLRESYKEFNNLLDFLNNLNRDVYRWKKWDIDEWVYDFKSINYIPVKWNEAITNFQNGIGYKDDLKVSMASGIAQTDASITLYNKSLETMNKYLSNKNITKDININFKRYNDILSTTPINYIIKASPMTRLYPNEIDLNIYEETNTTESVPIEDIYSKAHGVNISSNNSKITDVYPYKLKFESKDNSKEIEISKCLVKYINKTNNTVESSVDLLKEKNGFNINSLGVLTSSSIKQSITKVEHFNANSVYYFKNLEDNSGFKCTSNTASAIRTLYNLGGRQLICNSTCDMSYITQASGLIKNNNLDYVWERNNIVFNPDSRNKKVEIKITANKFSFDVKTNNTVNVLVRYSNTGNYSIIDEATYGTTWSTEEFDKPRYMEIIISTMSAEKVMIGNFKYSNYTIKFYTENKNNNYVELNKKNGVYTLPLSNKINLKVEVNSVSGGEPIINGIYIGNNITFTTYITDAFEAKSNCYRLLEIKTNAKITLIKRDILNTKDIEYQDDYDPVTSYYANTEGAWIRLNLSNYSVINDVYTDVGRVEIIEESGKIYYNIALEEQQSIKRITIKGIKNEATYTVSLLDVINRELANTNYRFDLTVDRLYCSKLTNGVIVVENNNSGKIKLLTLKSDLFNSINAVKYEFKNIPSNIGVKWGVGDGVYSDSITGSFDYISFYSEGSKIHIANNSYDLFTKELKNIPIAENFTNPESYDSSILNFYTVESNTENIGIRFYNYLDENKTYDELNNWSVGIKNLYIKNLNSLNNESIYDIKLATYSDKQNLAEYIDLKDSYTISDNNIIYTEQYIIEPPEGVSVEYLLYDGTSETEKLVKTEAIEINDSMFKKLKYSNIDKILYIGTNPPADGVESNFTDYDLLKQEGILIYTTKLTKGSMIYIKYTIKKPVALVFDLDTLYKLTGYTVETYKELSTYLLTNMKNGDTYDLNNFKDFKDSDLAYIICSEPSFEGQMLDEHTIKFNKHIEEKTIMIKTGYYYINGREYYLFSEDKSKTLYNTKHIQYENIDVSDDIIYTYKATNNYVRNSEMLMRNINDIYSYDNFKTIKDIKYNKYTSCESYNGWNTFNTTLELTNELYKLKLSDKDNNNKYEGFNNIGIKFNINNKNIINYAYIDITDLVSNTTYISLAATPKLNIYIGEEQLIDNIRLNHSLNIKPITCLIYKNSSIRTSRFNTKPNTRYYLITQGEGVIDDIILSDNLSENINYHVKNIEKFGLLFNENKHEGSIYRMEFKNNTNAIINNASFCSDGNIRPVGNIEWNITPIRKYNTMQDFLDKYSYKDTELIIDNYIKAPNNSSGRYITDYIEINPKIINRLIIKVNDIEFNETDNIRINILTCDNKKFSDKTILSVNNNIGFVYGRELLRYVKFELEIPEGHIVNNIEILAEYKSDNLNAPIQSTPQIGEIISPVYDSQECLKYSIKSININDLSNIKDIEVYIRSMEEENTAGIWSDWELVPLTCKNNKVIFDERNAPRYKFNIIPSRFFQIKIKVISQDAYVNFDSLSIEVKK